MNITLELLKELSSLGKIGEIIEGENKYGHKIYGFNYIGRHVWHWFRVDFKGETLLSFDHSYSTNTGVTKKGIMHSWKIIDRLKSMSESNGLSEEEIKTLTESLGINKKSTREVLMEKSM